LPAATGKTGHPCHRTLREQGNTPIALIGILLTPARFASDVVLRKGDLTNLTCRRLRRL